MSHYLLIESRDPLETRDWEFMAETAQALRKAGHFVTLFLVQNGVLAAREGAACAPLAAAANAGIGVLADDFSLSERGIGRLVGYVQPASLDLVIDQLVEGRKALWF